MIKITLEDINLKSPYEITLNNGDFDFTTDYLCLISASTTKMSPSASTRTLRGRRSQISYDLLEKRPGVEVFLEMVYIFLAISKLRFMY